MILYIFLIFFFQKQKSLNQNMNDDEKVNLLKQSMSILIEQNENALVWYLQKIQFFYCNFLTYLFLSNFICFCDFSVELFFVKFYSFL